MVRSFAFFHARASADICTVTLSQCGRSLCRLITPDFRLSPHNAVLTKELFKLRRQQFAVVTSGVSNPASRASFSACARTSKSRRVLLWSRKWANGYLFSVQLPADRLLIFLFQPFLHSWMATSSDSIIPPVAAVSGNAFPDRVQNGISAHGRPEHPVRSANIR